MMKYSLSFSSETICPAISMLPTIVSRSLSDLRLTARFLPFLFRNKPPACFFRAAFVRFRRHPWRLFLAIARHSLRYASLWTRTPTETSLLLVSSEPPSFASAALHGGFSSLSLKRSLREPSLRLASPCGVGKGCIQAVTIGLNTHLKKSKLRFKKLPPACADMADRPPCLRSKSTALGQALFIILMLCSQNLGAENIRGNVAGFVAKADDEVNFRLEELSVIDSPKKTRLQSGVEIQISIPAKMQHYQNGFAFFLYKNVSPQPKANKQSYDGTRVYMRLLPSRDFMYIRIPFDEEHDITGDALTQLLPMPVKPEDFPLIATILPVSKGIPDIAFTQNFTIKALPLWKDEGFISVVIDNLLGIPEERVSIIVSGREIAQGELTTLASGIHKIQVSSTHAPVVERTVVIEPGSNINVRISLDYRPPIVTILFPKGAKALLDGHEIDSSSEGVTLEVEAGKHTVTAIIGEYRVSREFFVRPGSRVGIELLVDIKIMEFGNETGNPFGSGDG